MSRTRGASRASHGPHTSPEALDGHCDPPALDRVEYGWASLPQCLPFPSPFEVDHCPKTWQMVVRGDPVECRKRGSHAVSRGKVKYVQDWTGVILRLWEETHQVLCRFGPV